MTETQTEVPEMSQMLIDAFGTSYRTLATLFEVDSDSGNFEVAMFSSVLAAMRPLPKDVQEEIIVPIIAGIFAELRADPTTQEGRRRAEPFADNIAAAIADATQIMLQNMRAQQQGAPSSLVMPKSPGLVV